MLHWLKFLNLKRQATLRKSFWYISVWSVNHLLLTDQHSVLWQICQWQAPQSYPLIIIISDCNRFTPTNTHSNTNSIVRCVNLAVVWFPSQHLGGHPECRTHQRQLSVRTINRKLHHLSSKAEICHHCLSAVCGHSDQAVLQNTSSDFTQWQHRR